MGKVQLNKQDLNKLRIEIENKVALELLRKIKRKAPVDKGELRAKYSFVSGTVSSSAKIVNDTPHARPIEYGTVPFTPPLEPLKNWGKRVLGDENIGVAVWNKIRKKGIRPQPHVRPAIDEIKLKYN